MTPTDEALVAEALEFAKQLSTVFANYLYDEHEQDVTVWAAETIKCLASRLSALSQPPSGGWDDAAVERDYRAWLNVEGPRLFVDGYGMTNAATIEKAFKAGMRAALNAAAPRESLSVEKEDE